MGLYERIEQLCAKKGITVTLLCRECAVARANLSDLKMGRLKSLSATTLAKIAGYFGVSVEYLLGNENLTSEEDRLKAALFGGGEEVTDEMWNEVKRYAMYVKERENGNK